eukprot:GHRQ01030447.1.p2 GENE.GHRQ01030447.1~~GHRQ01030447.1.p2  ORF type:complete len:108 (+),score=2.84 GHRQ01030447.1:328-651(+)
MLPVSFLKMYMGRHRVAAVVLFAAQCGVLRPLLQHCLLGRRFSINGNVAAQLGLESGTAAASTLQDHRSVQRHSITSVTCSCSVRRKEACTAFQIMLMALGNAFSKT